MAGTFGAQQRPHRARSARWLIVGRRTREPPVVRVRRPSPAYGARCWLALSRTHSQARCGRCCVGDSALVLEGSKKGHGLRPRLLSATFGRGDSRSRDERASEPNGLAIAFAITRHRAVGSSSRPVRFGDLCQEHERGCVATHPTPAAAGGRRNSLGRSPCPCLSLSPTNAPKQCSCGGSELGECVRESADHETYQLPAPVRSARTTGSSRLP